MFVDAEYEDGHRHRPVNTTPRLVCEGRCNNGKVERFNEAVRRGVPDIALGRTLVHTPHIYAGSNLEAEFGRVKTRRHLFRCRVCDRTRLYGLEGETQA